MSHLGLAQTTDLIQAVHDWEILARQDQTAPDKDWLLWLLMGGRGCGKTRAGAEWIRAQVKAGAKRVSLVAPTLNDAREVMLEGESGLLNIGLPQERPKFISSRRRLEWPNGAIGYLFSAEDPDSLRGPQCDVAWADEYASWSYPDQTLSNLRLGLRLGNSPKLVVTTTPRPTPAMRRLIATPGLVMSRAKTSDNVHNLSPDFLNAMEFQYGGTRLGRQELDGELLEDIEGGLWTRDMLERAKTDQVPELERVIVVIDPPATSGPKADRCGLIVAGRAGDHAYILSDCTTQGQSPEAWARLTVSLYHEWEADCIIAETNQGGDMVVSLLRQVDPNVPVRKLHASRSKRSRAEPIAALYEMGRVHHTARLDALEDELVLMGSLELKHSPDRADALVWAVTSLLDISAGNPRVRTL